MSSLKKKLILQSHVGLVHDIGSKEMHNTISVVVKADMHEQTNQHEMNSKYICMPSPKFGFLQKVIFYMAPAICHIKSNVSG